MLWMQNVFGCCSLASTLHTVIFVLCISQLQHRMHYNPIEPNQHVTVAASVQLLCTCIGAADQHVHAIHFTAAMHDAPQPKMNPSSMTWLQDLFSFCALALLLHISIFVLYITRARTYYHGPSDVVKRVVNIFLGAFPTGLATVLIFSLVDCSSPARTHMHARTHACARTHVHMHTYALTHAHTQFVYKRSFAMDLLLPLVLSALGWQQFSSSHW